MTRTFLSVVIPAWNEATRLPPTLSKVIKYLEQRQYTSEVVVVTDGSTDGTAEVAESFASIYPFVRVISFPFNKGKGFGTREGMLAAKGEYRLFMDADYAVPATYIDSFLRKARQGFDIVIGSRSHPEAQIQAAQKFPRKQLAVAFGQLQKSVLNIPFEDTQCGFKMFTAAATETLFPKVTFDCAYFDAELLYIAHKMKAKVFEHPVTWTHDQETRLPIGLKRTVDIVGKMLRIKRLHGNVSGRISTDVLTKQLETANFH